MAILITGSTGFVGKSLFSYLEDRKTEISELFKSELLNGTFDKVTQAEVVVHLAGKAHDLKKIAATADYNYVNYELTKNLYDAFLKSPATKFIFISSVKAAADAVDEILTEDIIPNPQTAYGKSKLMAEEYIKSQVLPSGKSYYILRPCMIHGPGNKGNLNLLYQFVSKGIPYPLAAFGNKRSFLSIENLCFVILEIIKRTDIPPGIYNVADDETLSTNQVVSLIALQSNQQPRLLKLSPGLIKILARLGDIFKLPLNTERLKKLTEDYIVSNNKLKSAMRKEFPVSSKDGIIKTIRSFRS